MKILHVITSLRTGGAEKLMVDLLPRLKELGNEVELLVFDGIRTPFYLELEKKGIKIHSLTMGKEQFSPWVIYNPLNFFRLLPHLKGYDIIHTHNTAAQLFVAVGTLLSKCQLVTTEHSTNNRRRTIPGLKILDKWMFNQYQKIICISKKAEDNLREYLNNCSQKICTIENGIDLSKYIQAKPNTDLQVQYQDLHLGIMVAGFRLAKDHNTLIKAYQFLPDDYHLLLAGPNIETEDDCKKLTETLGLSERIHFLGSRSDVPALLKTAEVVVMSSHYEGLSLSSVEGMACGNPFIASNVEGLKEVVQGAGILFPHEDAKKLAEEIKRLTTEKEYREKTISLCQERAKNYDISTMAQKYNELYKN